jgi:hypothetical protein
MTVEALMIMKIWRHLVAKIVVKAIAGGRVGLGAVKSFVE